MTTTRSKLLASLFATVMVLSMIAMGATFVGANADRNHGLQPTQASVEPPLVGQDRADAAIRSGDTFWQGQRLGVEIPPDVHDAEQFQVRAYDTGNERIGSLVREFALDQNRQAYVRTSNLDGSYVIVPAGERDTVVWFDGDDGVATDVVGEANAQPFEVAVQTLEIEWGQDRITTKDSEVEINVESNRARYNLRVSADGLRYSDLENVFRSTAAHRSANDPFADRNPFTNGHQTYDAFARDHEIVVRGGEDHTLLADFRQVDPGTYTFEFEVTDTGVTTAALPGDDDEVEPDPDPEFFEVSDLDPAIATLEPGEEFTITATVTNTGEAEGTQVVELRIDGDGVAADELTLDVDEDVSVSLTATAPDEVGVYTHGIYTADDFQEGSLSVEDPEEEPIDEDVDEDIDEDVDEDVDTDVDEDEDVDTDVDDEDTDTDVDDEDVDEDIDETPGFGVAVAVLALFGAIVLVARRR